MPIVKTRPEAATILAVSVKSIGDWKKEPGFPHRDDDQYDTDAIAAWREAKNQQRTKNTAISEQVSLKTKAVKLQILETKRLADEIDLERKRGNLIPRELYLELLNILVGRVRDAATNLTRQGNIEAAKTISTHLAIAEKQIHDRLDRAVRESEK